MKDNSLYIAICLVATLGFSAIALTSNTPWLACFFAVSFMIGAVVFTVLESKSRKSHYEWWLKNNENKEFKE